MQFYTKNETYIYYNFYITVFILFQSTDEATIAKASFVMYVISMKLI